MDYLLRRLAKSAARRGMGGEHWAWFVIALAAYTLRRARRAEAPLVTSMKVSPGDRFLVTLHRNMAAATASAAQATASASATADPKPS